MPGWLRAATVAASRWNLCRKLTSLEYCSASTLMATGMSSRGWVDRYPTPMAPRPSSASIGYRPSWVVLKGVRPVCPRAPGIPANYEHVVGGRPLAEDGERHVDRNPEDGLVDDLA